MRSAAPADLNHHEPLRRPEDPGIRPTVAEIDLGALGRNLREVRRLVPPGTLVMGIVKADAYGHGAVPVSRALCQAGVDWLGVALVEEGIQLRRAGVAVPILVLGGAYPNPGYDSLLAHRLTPVVFTRDHLDGLSAAAARAGMARIQVHLKVDTGMGRIGLLPDELGAYLLALRAHPEIEVAGLCSHFANADLLDRVMAQKQVARFAAAAEAVRAAGHPLALRHLANSAAVMDLPEGRDVEMVRPGIMLYGCVPAQHFRSHAALVPVMALKSAVVHQKRVGPDFPVSYGGRFVTRRESVIATVPVGYADGYPRALSNRGQALVRGRRVPIAGAVCMDMLMLDVTDVPGAALGDEVVLIGRQGEEEITADEVAEHAGTICYEILCGIGARVPRRIVS